jgi:hypothetical protein
MFAGQPHPRVVKVREPRVDCLATDVVAPGAEQVIPVTVETNPTATTIVREGQGNAKPEIVEIHFTHPLARRPGGRPPQYRQFLPVALNP